MDVYPVHLLDNAENYRKLFMSYIFLFNDVLDAQKLADSLSKLLETGDWRKLSGRLRKNNHGQFEIHVPGEFTHKVPAINFSHETFGVGVDEHPLGKQLPDLTGLRSVQPFSAGLRAFSGIPNVPHSTEELMERDAPLLSLHVTCFADATVVGIAWPHVIMDAMGLQALLRNWSLVLNGKVDDVLPLIGVHKDPLQDAVDQDVQPKEELVLEKLSIGILGIIILLFRLIGMKLWNPSFEERMIVLSQQGLDRLCQRARKDLAMQDDEKTFVSEGDVLAAWVAQVIAASHPKPTPVTIASFINIRFRLESLKGGQPGEYIQSLLQFAYASFATGCADAPLGRTALSYRQQLAEQATEAQVLAYIRMQREHVRDKGNKLRLMFGDASAAMLTVNNLAKADFFHNVNFSGAVASGDKPPETTENRKNPPGTIIYFYPLVLNEPPVLTSHLRVLGKDHGGKVLLSGTFQPNTWETFVKELEDL